MALELLPEAQGCVFLEVRPGGLSDNGSRCGLIPADNKRSVLEVNTDVIDKIDPIFYNNVKTATFKGLDWN